MSLLPKQPFMLLVTASMLDVGLPILGILIDVSDIIYKTYERNCDG